MGAIFRGNDGKYTITELAKLLRVDEKTLASWTKIGLKISAYAKDGLTKPRKPIISNSQPRLYCGLIDLNDLKKFFRKKPEAYDLSRLGEETRFILELHQIKEIRKQKKVFCKRCQLHFWTEIHNDHLRCPQCRSITSKWARDYR